MTAREQQLETAIRDALSALGSGNCDGVECEGCHADADAARDILAGTGLTPSGFENWPVQLRRQWSDVWGVEAPWRHQSVGA